MRVRVRVTTNGGGFCGFCGSVSQTVDIAYFSRFWACGSLVVFACGFVVGLWLLLWFLYHVYYFHFKLFPFILQIKFAHVFTIMPNTRTDRAKPILFKVVF